MSAGWEWWDLCLGPTPALSTSCHTPGPDPGPAATAALPSPGRRPPGTQASAGQGQPNAGERKFPGQYEDSDVQNQAGRATGSEQGAPLKQVQGKEEGSGGPVSPGPVQPVKLALFLGPKTADLLQGGSTPK